MLYILVMKFLTQWFNYITKLKIRVGFYFVFAGTYGISRIFRLLHEIILIHKNVFLLTGKPDNNSA